MPESLKNGTITETYRRILDIKGLNAEVLSEDPWIVKLPKFLTDEEIEFLTLDRTRGEWKTASDTGALDAHGRHTQVYSSNRKTDVTWCDCNCQNHPVAKRLVARVSELSRIHPDYMESMQFLRYKPGMYYKPHHDTARTDRNNPNNVAKHRVYTFFMYLSDVTKGGGTRFPRLNLTVQPERGSAIMWPSVMDSDPWEIDHRTQHEALVVEEGEKLSMNLWLFLGPRVLAHNVGCSGSPIG
jgi:prolyl 4-hydroxylase